MVVMPEYLTVTAPKQTASKPRIISEVKKNCLSKLKLSFTTSLQDFGKSKYSGQLLWNADNSGWVLTVAEVRQGSLVLVNKETSAVELKQPLRELNLRACSAPRTFCLAEAKGVRLLVFQALGSTNTFFISHHHRVSSVLFMRVAKTSLLCVLQGSV